MSSLKKTIKFNPLEVHSAISKKTEAPKRKPAKKIASVKIDTPAELKKTIKSNSLEAPNNISNKTEAPQRKQAKQTPPEETSIPPQQPLKTIDYVIQESGEHGSSPLLTKGSDFGFDVPELGFFSLKSPLMFGQLKNHFLMPRLIGGFVLGSSFGDAVSYILGKPRNKHYFFLLKSNHGKLVFSCIDSPTLAYVINKIYT